MEQALTKLGADKIIGIYCANDGLASGAIAALKGHGVTPLPPVTGQDSELAAIQRIVTGDQYMTIYKAVTVEAEAAARMAVAAALGQPLTDATVVQVNGSGDKVPSVLLPVVAVTRETIADTLVKSGVYTAAQICVDAAAAPCKQIGL